MPKCCCVTSTDCCAPANGPGSVRTMCYQCGDYVCRACSRLDVVEYHVRTRRARWVRRHRRICDRCREERERFARDRGGHR